MPSFPLPEYDFNNSIPQPTDNPSTSQGQILGNNVSNVNIWQVDHIGFNTTGSGYHQQVRMPNFTLASIAVPPTVIAGFGGTYCDNTISTGANTESGLWYTPDASTNKYQLTRTITTKFATFSTNTTYSANLTGGWTFLPGGMLFQYGSFNPNVITTVTFPVAFKNTPYSIQLTIVASNNSTYRTVIQAGTVSTTGFTFFGSVDSHVTPVYWTAVGV